MKVAPRKKRIMKKIVSRSYWRSRNHPVSAKDSVTCVLECGHRKRFKGSQEPSGDLASCIYCTDEEWHKKIRQQETPND